LAITLVNARNDPEYSFVSIPYEFSRASITAGDLVKVVDTQGENLGQVPVVSVNSIANSDRTLIVRVKAPKAFAVRIAGIEIQDKRIRYLWTNTSTILRMTRSYVAANE